MILLFVDISVHKSQPKQWSCILESDSQVDSRIHSSGMWQRGLKKKNLARPRNEISPRVKEAKENRRA